ncbi:tail protein [Escherichia phage EcS1]|uniref:Phage tail fibers n=1 Tax=Escherichia phage EcS1 TaxID=2083276 RepID=A0A2Z5ZCP2_9CAUD|nr:tail protein [Escherichia phage EcS1]BBC78246.1 Phage tail fibers [Escherichia phage EcS1]
MAIPSVTITPVNASPQLGQTLTINSVVEFDPTDVYTSYKWELSGADTGVTTATYTKANITSADAGSYVLKVMHGVDAGSATETASSPAVITTLPATTVSIVSTTTDIYVGDTLTITATPTGVPSGATVGAYEWSKGGTVVSGQTTSTLTKTVAAGDAGSYTAKVSYTVTGQAPIKTAASNAISVTVGPALAFATNLNATASVSTGQALTLTVAASGGKSPYTYQWKKGSANIGTNLNTFIVPSADSTTAGTYTVEVTDAASHKITSASCVVTVVPALSLSTDLSATKSVVSGKTLTLTIVAANGKTPYTYQWKRAGVEIPSETAATFTKSASPADAGTYTCEVTDDNNDKITSNTCVVTVSLLPDLEVLWTVHPIPWRDTSFTPLGYWVLDEILLQKADGKDWKTDYATYHYTEEVQTILEAFNAMGEVEIQDSRNGYIHKMSLI